jgi:META domain
VRSTIAILSLSVLVSSLAACGARASTDTPGRVDLGHAATPVQQPAVHSNPLDLIGIWKVKAPVEGRGVALRLGEELILFRHCGEIQGAWRADHGGRFVDYVDSEDGSCSHRRQAIAVPWLTETTGYRVHGRSRLLLNSAGHVVARLSPGAHPTVSSHDSPSDALPVRLTPAIRARLAPSPPLSHGLRPANPDAIVGRWRALGAQTSNTSGYVQFNPNGRWVGSDGCNGATGRYAIDDSGRLVITDGLSTLVGCNGSPAMYWAESTRRIGVDGRRLVLLDVHGRVLGRLAPRAIS